MLKDIMAERLANDLMRVDGRLTPDEEVLTKKVKECEAAVPANITDLTDRRTMAIAAMRGSPAFLGANGSKGLAFKPPTWEASEPCYFCQGIWGCESCVNNGYNRGIGEFRPY
jgi:hypothetical protein